MADAPNSHLNFYEYFKTLIAGAFDFKVSPERFDMVYENLAEGSQPEARFYVMVIVSTLIAGFGLLSDSTAIVIGAMLVAPLMTPIFGISLALLREDAVLLNRAARAEVLGMIAAIVMGFLVGWLLLSLDPYSKVTPEMLSRTKPNLSDLIVAVLAGFAGAYAMVDEKISPILPGVAIATAIVPPLANCGLCLAFGAYNGALGSFLLFFANFISILLTASLLFYKAGMARAFGPAPAPKIFRRFGLAAICFVVMVGALGNSLYTITRERMIHHTVKKVLAMELANYATTGVDKLFINIKDGKVHALAQILSPNPLASDNVQRIEDELAEKLDMPTTLIIREISANDVSSGGSNVAISSHTLDGFLISRDIRPEVRLTQDAERIIQKSLETLPLRLIDLEKLDVAGRPVILGKIAGAGTLSPTEIKELESRIRIKAKQPNLKLVFRFEDVSLYGQDGPIRYGWETLITPNAKELAVNKALLGALEAAFERDERFFLEEVHCVIEPDGYAVLAELRGAGAFDRADLARLQRDLGALADKPVKFYAWINQGPVMTEKGPVSYDELVAARMDGKADKETKELYDKVLRRVR